jgi:regulator of sirC expression with transglutaminase-like and TPR domain
MTARRVRALALVAACSIALGACSNTTRTTSVMTTDVGAAAAGSEVNIASLSAVVQQNPQDASAYNVRGTAYGRAGKYREAIADFGHRDKASAYRPRAEIIEREVTALQPSAIEILN